MRHLSLTAGAGLVISVFTTTPVPALANILQACATEAGFTRIVATGTVCNFWERTVTWNIVGPQGPPGPRGGLGLQGGVGTVGATGAAGPQGPDGAGGPVGASGPRGATGGSGGSGATGPAGATGSVGAAGPTGPTGPQGAQTVGGAGPGGPQGPTGPAGPNGPTGPTGPTTQSLLGTSTTSASDGRSGFAFGCTIGQIGLAAGAVAGDLKADGRILQISSNTALFSVLGTQYGGDGRVTFALPDLRGVAPNGLTYWICTQGVFPSRL